MIGLLHIYFVSNCPEVQHYGELVQLLQHEDHGLGHEVHHLQAALLLGQVNGYCTTYKQDFSCNFIDFSSTMFHLQKPLCQNLKTPSS